MIYTYRCLTCRTITEADRTIATRNDTPPCDACGEETEKIIMPINTIVHGIKKGEYNSKG